MSNTRKLFESFQNNLNEYYDEEEEEIFDNVHEDNYKFGDVNYKLPSGKYIHFHNETNGEGYYYAIYENGKEIDGGTLLYSEIDAKPQTERDILRRLAELSDLPEIADATEKVDQEVIDSFDESALTEEVKPFKKRFKEWLDDNVKSQDYNLNAYIDDLTTQWGETGRTQYELSKFKSKSGNPELFDYDEEDLKELGYNLDEEVEETIEDKINVSDLKRIALETLPKEDIDTHDSDLYIKVTPESTALINKLKDKDSGLLTTFKSEIDGKMWYDIPFANMEDDYKDKMNENEEVKESVNESEETEQYFMFSLHGKKYLVKTTKTIRNKLDARKIFNKIMEEQGKDTSSYSEEEINKAVDMIQTQMDKYDVRIDGNTIYANNKYGGFTDYVDEVTLLEYAPEIKEYRYITNHGIGPGATPEGVYIRSEDLPNGKTAIYLNRPLTDEELKKYDIKPEWIQENTLNEVGEGHTYDFVYGGDYDEFKVDGKTVYRTSYVKRNVPVYSDDKEELRKHAENIFSEMIENAKAEDLVMIERDRATNTIYNYLLQHNYYDEEPIEENTNEEYKYDGTEKFPNKIKSSDGYILTKVDDGTYENAFIPTYMNDSGDETLVPDVDKYVIIEESVENVNEEDNSVESEKDVLKEKIKDILENEGYKYSDISFGDNPGIEIECYPTPLGEDWIESFDFSSAKAFIKSLEDRINGWDSDEEAAPYIEMRGQRGVPNDIRGLLDDADWKLEQLKDLYSKLSNLSESAKPLTTKGLMESLHNLKEDYEDDDYEDEEDIYAKAENWDGNMANDELEDYEWKEILDNAPEIYKQALRAREAYVKDSWGEIPDLVWNEIESLIDEGAFGNPDNISPEYIIDNIIINGDYGDFDNYKQDDETDEEFISRVEDSVFAIFPEERFVIFSL